MKTYIRTSTGIRSTLF